MIRSNFRKTVTTPSSTVRVPPQRQKRHARSVGRFVYLVLVLAFGTYLLGRLMGHLVVLNAVGLVASDRFVVGAAYTARVVDVHVNPGDTVRAGQVMARLESPDVLATLAQLVQNLALIEAQHESLIKRQRVIESIIPVAKRRLAVARDGEKRLGHDAGRGMATQMYRSTILTEAFEAERDLATLQSELTSSELELKRISANLNDVRSAIEATKTSYAHGIITATVDGTVSATVASPGQVLTAGEPVMELLNGTPYVLAYLANGRLYNVKQGDRVILTDGVRTTSGHVNRLDMVTDNLPIDFRTAFGAPERRQVMRVEVDGSMPFPYLSRVTVVSPWSFGHVFATIKEQLSAFMGWAKDEAANPL